MRRQEQPFICYRRGKWSFHIVPSNRAGWLALALWTLGLVVAAQALVWLLGGAIGEGTAATVLITGGVIVVATVWSIALVRWTMARSEIIDLDALDRTRQGQERSRKRRS